MEEMRVYIANLGKYNEGELGGDWFTPPVDYDEMAERIGLNDRYEEYAIHDYELPFEIDEYTPIEEVNRLCEMVEELDYPLNEVIDDLLCHFCSVEELYDHKDDIIRNYIDYEAFARDIDLEGCFIETRYGVFECPY